MTLLQLEYVATVVREGTILAAADKLHVSHPSISKAINSLEGELGIRLFARTNIGTTPTAEGLAVAESAERILDELNRLRHTLNISVRTSIFLNVFPLDTTPYLMEIISQIRKQFPQLSIHVHQDTLTNVMASVIAQECDLGIVALPLRSLRELSPKLRIHPFRSERLAAACAAGHPLASQEYVTIQQLCSYPLVLHDDKIIMDILSDLFRAHQENLALTYSNNNTLIRQMVYKGEAVSIYTTALEKTDPLVCSGGIKLIPLKDSSPADDLFQISFSCLSYPKRQLNPCERQFIRLLQSVDEAGEKIFVSSF